MLKKRLIFVLYFDSGSFYLSRNFRLQRVGDVRWLVDKFRFQSIGRFVDEIMVLDVSRKSETPRCDGSAFTAALTYLMKETFVPMTIGGGIRGIEDAKRCFAMGSDKILFNTPILTNPDLVRECVTRFGAQAIVGAIDVKADDKYYTSKIANGQELGLPLEQHLQRLVELGVGEVMINSIDQDGTGTGYDMDLVSRCQSLNVPLIVAGGAGKPEHFAAALSLPTVEAAATGNLFNFLGKGFELVRSHLIEQHLPVRNASL
jgi:cyclase